MADPTKLDLADGFARISAAWTPLRAARVDDHELRLARLEGSFVWHSHLEADELFLVWSGHLRIEYRDGAVELGPGELHVVPRGTEHRPVSEQGCEVLLFERAEVVNTGDAGGERTAEVEDL